MLDVFWKKTVNFAGKFIWISACMSYKNASKHKAKIKNCPDYLFNGNMIVNIKYFDSSLLEINKLSFKGVFGLNIYYIKYITTKSPNRVSINRTDNEEDFLCFFLDDVDGHTEKKQWN